MDGADEGNPRKTRLNCAFFARHSYDLNRADGTSHFPIQKTNDEN